MPHSQVGFFDRPRGRRQDAPERPGGGKPVRVRVLTRGLLAWLLAALAALAVSGTPRSRDAGRPEREDFRAPVSALAFSGDGRRLAVATEDGVLTVRDLAAREEVSFRRGEAGMVRSLSFSPDGKVLASAGRGLGVRFWDGDAGGWPRLPRVEEVRERSWDDGALNSVVAFSPDGATLAAAGQGDGTVSFLEPGTGRVRGVWGGGRGRVHVLAYSPDGRTLAAAGVDGVVRLWDGATGRERAAFRAHRAGVWSLTFSPDGATLASAGALDRELRLWDAATGRPRGSFLAPNLLGGLAVAISPRRPLLADGGSAGEVRFWDPADGRPLAVLRGHRSPIQTLAFSPDGATLATGSMDRTLRLWDVARALAGAPAEIADPADRGTRRGRPGP